MLKIKDNVDLKELEKFGFNLIEKCIIPRGAFGKEEADCYVKPDKRGEYHSWCTFIKCTRSREIVAPIYDMDNLYDLIKADLVEKVGKKCVK